jgi:hypothetical protein
MKYVSTGLWSSIGRMTEEMNKLARNKMVRFTQIVHIPSDALNMTMWCAIIGYDDFVETQNIKMIFDEIMAVPFEGQVDNIGT